MKQIGNAILLGVGFTLGACLVYFVVWPWIRAHV